MPTPQLADIVVVGNGMIGLTIAQELKARDAGLDVLAVGPEDRAGGASQAAGAMLGCFGEVTKYTLASPPALAKFELSLAAHRIWGEFLEALDEGSDIPLGKVDDTFVILNARSGALDSENFEALRQALDRYDEPYEEVEHVPGLDATPDGRPLRTILLPREGAVDGRRALAAVARLGRRSGVRFADGRVEEIVPGPNSVAVRLDDGSTVEAGHVVVAAGVFSGPLLETVAPGIVQPILAGAGMAYVGERTAGAGFTSVVRSINRGGSCGLHVVPLEARREYYGATNVVFLEPELRPHIGVCHFLAGCAMDQLDQQASFSRIDEIRIGNRPVPLDTYPLLGPVAPDVTLVTGTYRDGFHAAPVLANMAADTVISGASAFPPVLDPTRAPLSTMSRSESIDEFISQAVSSAYENDTRLSRFMHHRDLEEVFRPRAEAMYSSLPDDVVLEPDILHFMVLNRKSEADLVPIRTYLEGLHGRGSKTLADLVRE